MDNEQVTDDLVKVNIGAPPDPVAQASKMFPRPKPIYLGRRREKELKQEFKRVKKGLIKKAKDKVRESPRIKFRQGWSSILYRLFNPKTIKLSQDEMKQVKEEAISIIERKVNGNTTNK